MGIKMSRTQKEKLETYTEISLQATPKISKKESTVTAADSYKLASNQEKRKNEADKPLYFKRV
jgi:CRISPR/Cas system endoribonuclease Cas6 (RAMP superfamily)